MEAKQVFEMYKNRVLSRCEVDVGRTGCLVWKGAVWGNTGYGVISLRIPGSHRKLFFRVHRLMYALEHMAGDVDVVNFNVLTPPGTNNEGTPLEVSHICHNKLCVKPCHLTLESHQTNTRRNACKHQNSCLRDHTPHCIFPGKFLYLL